MENIKLTEDQMIGIDWVICNHATSVSGMAMRGEISIDGDNYAVYCTILDGQEQDDINIYTADNICHISQQ